MVIDHFGHVGFEGGMDPPVSLDTRQNRRIGG